MLQPVNVGAIAPARAWSPALPTTISESDESRHGCFAVVTGKQTRCNTCNTREFCLPCRLLAPDVKASHGLFFTQRRIGQAQATFRAGDRFDSLYVVKRGFFKSRVGTANGVEQVTGFHMVGDLMGMDGIGTDQHTVDSIALEDSEVCVIPYSCLEAAPLQRQLQKALSREIVRGQNMMILLGSMTAEERLVTFLLNLSQRLVACGYSPSDFNLRMTRSEIGSYINLSLETVSRLFSRFQHYGLLNVQTKRVRILDLMGLHAMVMRRT